MQKQSIVIEPHKSIKEFRLYLLERENAPATIDKYLTDINTFCRFLDYNYEISKQRILEYKMWLQEHYAVSSVNSMLAALSQFLEFLGVSSMKVKRVKVQKQMILQEEQLLSENEYHKLIRTAYKKGQKSLGMIMETIPATGIRISELKYFTVGAVRRGNIIIHNKGKIRRILIPGAIRKKLLYYCFIHKINDGIIFITKNGNAQNRSNIWTQMKKLSKAAGIAAEKVYPHAFRHLFARMYYQLTSDISGLADILGHSSIETTRIYTADSEQKYLASMERLELLLSDIRLPEGVTE